MASKDRMQKGDVTGRMPDDPKLTPNLMAEISGSGTGELELMAPVPDLIEPAKPGHVTDQIERPPDDADTEREEGYVRLRVRVENCELSIVGARTVEGPLVAEERLQGELIYEATCDQKRIAVGAIPDAGEIRGFPHPKGAPGQEHHAIIEEPSYEFHLRIPRCDISRDMLARIRVTLYRIKGDAPILPLGAEARCDLNTESLREVARLDGIRLENIAKRVQEKLLRALR